MLSTFKLDERKQVLKGSQERLIENDKEAANRNVKSVFNTCPQRRILGNVPVRNNQKIVGPNGIGTVRKWAHSIRAIGRHQASKDWIASKEIVMRNDFRDIQYNVRFLGRMGELDCDVLNRQAHALFFLDLRYLGRFSNVG